MNAKRIILNLFLLLVLLIGLVSAQEDFTATSSRTVELCPCSNQAYAVTVENTGTTASSYTILASGVAKEWVTFNPDKFVLNPGQKGSFYVIVNSDCNVKGNYGLEIFIITNNRLTKVVKQVLKFSQCYDYSLEQGKVVERVEESLSFLQHDGSYSLCKDEQKSIPILITNNENFGNRYKLFLDAPEWAKLNTGSVSLAAKKSGIFLINLDKTDAEGKFNFKLDAISELGKVQRKKNIEVDVGECYALGVELEKEKDVICGGEDKSYDVILKNAGTLGQNVNIAVDGPDWAGFENTALQSKFRDKDNVALNLSDNESESSETEPKLTLSGKKVLQLNPGEEKTARLNVNPPEDISGHFEIIVHATPDNKTEFRSSDTINVNVMEKLACYQADIITKISVTNFYNEDFFFAKVKNDGIKKAAYDVSLEGVSWVSVDPTTLELNPGQTGNLNLNVDPGTDVEPGNYDIKINLESNDGVYSKNVDIILKKESELVKKLKAGVKFYQYYLYLSILLIILIILLIRPIIRIKNKTQKSYEHYKVKRERLRALKLARKEREEERKKEEEKKKEEELKEQEHKKREEERKREEKKKKKELEEERLKILEEERKNEEGVRKAKLREEKRKERRKKVFEFFRGLGLVKTEKEQERQRTEEERRKKKKEESRIRPEKEAPKEPERKKQREKKFKIHINKIWIYILVLITALIFIGHNARLFNAKYLHIYIRNLFVGYLYYILIGVGVVVILFLLLLFYNFISKEEKKKRKVKKETKKAEKKTKKKKQYNAPYFKILTIILLSIIIYSVFYFDLIKNIKDFFVLYQFYIISGIAILVVIILLIRFYKPLFKFLKE
jgi:uncharacterized membrane protein/Na+-transporting methylmalonyl-CoA/oxaloacetate decarboxylase gamma subunit